LEPSVAGQARDFIRWTGAWARSGGSHGINESHKYYGYGVCPPTAGFEQNPALLGARTATDGTTETGTARQRRVLEPSAAGSVVDNTSRQSRWHCKAGTTGAARDGSRGCAVLGTGDMERRYVLWVAGKQKTTSDARTCATRTENAGTGGRREHRPANGGF